MFFKKFPSPKSHLQRHTLGWIDAKDYYHCFSHQVAAAKLPVDRLGQLGSWGAGNYYCRVKLLALIGRTNISISLEAIF